MSSRAARLFLPLVPLGDSGRLIRKPDHRDRALALNNVGRTTIFPSPAARQILYRPPFT